MQSINWGRNQCRNREAYTEVTLWHIVPQQHRNKSLHRYNLPIPQCSLQSTRAIHLRTNHTGGY